MAKSIRLIAWLAVFAASAGAQGEEGVHLFILSGQSNMAGLDPNVSFTPAVKEAFGADKVVVVKDAQGGEPIRRWYKQWHPEGGGVAENNGDLYERLIEKVKGAIEGRQVASVTFVWMQGERDAREGHGDVYAESLAGLVEQLATDLEREDIYFVIGRLSDFDNENRQYPHWTKVREAQVAVADASERGGWVDTDDLNGDNDGLHYTREGYATLGQRFAEKAIALLGGQAR